MSTLRIRFDSPGPNASTESVRALLTRTLHSSRPRARIVEIERAPCAYGSSWWLEDITLQLDDGSEIRLVFKDLSREATGSGARRVKPSFVIDPAREAWTYRTLLPEAPPAPPKLWAAVSDCDTGRHWLFVERVSGAPLTEIGDHAAWCAAAHWLGHFHVTSCVPHADAPLLRHDPGYHRAWFARALFAAHEHARKKADDSAREKLARLRRLAPVHERAVKEALALGYSLIHGEFYAANVLAEQCGSAYAIHPVDWEMTALGAPLFDLAALTSGGWNRHERIAMVNAYREGKNATGARCLALDECMRLVTACRLLLAVQWLGWAAGWTAPVDHRNDWLEEAERCAEELRG
jgi:aminoglycoside phosphotransferase (APT) family kinase protein